MDADLQKMFGELLISEIEKAGADGIVNLDFKETQHPTATKIFFAIFFFIPLPTSVEITGEFVEFTDAPAPAEEVGSDDLGMLLPALPGLVEGGRSTVPEEGEFAGKWLEATDAASYSGNSME